MVAAGASWLRVLAFLVLCRVVVDGSLVFPSASPDSPLARLSVYAAAVTSFTGPQPEDASNVRNGIVVLFSGDVCHPIPMRAPGSIIVITSESASDTACSFESIYLALYATGAAAAIWPAVDNVPSYYLYSNDGSRGARTRHLPMLFLRIGPSNDVYTTLLAYAPEQNATVSPDVNMWKATLESWYYQLFIRILPGTALMGLGCTAIVYFAFHMRIIDDAYKGAVPEERRSLARRSEHFRHSFGLPHAVLAIEMCTATVSGIVVAIDGLHSTPNLPFPVVEFFMTLLSGWSFAASLLSASVWTKQVLELIESKTFLTRIIRGDYPTVFIVLVVVPIAVDTSISAVWSTYYYSDTLTGIAAVILFLFQLTLGLHVLGSVLRYYRFVSEVQSQTVSAAGRAQGMDALLARLSRCALGMSLSTMMVCFGTALSAASIKFLNSPTGWTVCFAFAYTGRALDTAFRVAMFKPRSTRRQAITMRAVEIVPKTGEFVLLRGSTHPGSAQGASASGLRNSTNPQQ